MKIWTWGEMKAKIENDLNLKDELFIEPNELLGYANDAIDEAEQEFVAMYDKYFETYEDLALVAGQSVYELPSDIYGNKITLIQYDNGSIKYPIRKLRDLNEIAHVCVGDDYKFRIINRSGIGARLELFPPSRETSASNARIYYLRNASEVIDDDSIIDMPEASGFIMQHIKDSCMNKEMGSLYQAPPSAALEKQRGLMLMALGTMIPDEDNLVEQDTSFYLDFDNNFFSGGYN